MTADLEQKQGLEVVAWDIADGRLIAADEWTPPDPGDVGLVRLSEASAEIERLRRERDVMLDINRDLRRKHPLAWKFDMIDTAVARAEAAEARLAQAEEVLRAVSDTSHRTPDREHYQFPIAIMERLDTFLKEKGQ